MLRMIKFSTTGLKHAALVAGLGWVMFASSAGAEGSLTELDIEYSELKVALDKVLGENQQLRDLLADTQRTLADMRQSLAATSAEAEVFKRQSLELKLRMEALGLDSAGSNNAKLEQRLLAAVNDLRVTSQDRKTLSEALVRLSDAAAVYAKSASGAPAETRLTLESEIRNANQALGLGAGKAVEAAAVAPTITDGQAIGVKDELSLVVINLGSRQGVKVGMPFRAVRGEKTIGVLQVVDVREKISGAVIQHLSSEREAIKVGDRLVVDARP